MSKLTELSNVLSTALNPIMNTITDTEKAELLHSLIEDDLHYFVTPAGIDTLRLLMKKHNGWLGDAFSTFLVVYSIDDKLITTLTKPYSPDLIRLVSSDDNITLTRDVSDLFAKYHVGQHTLLLFIVLVRIQLTNEDDG